MSMSDDVDRAGAQNKQGNDLKNPYASGAAGQNPGQPGTGLPGLAAFGKMQTYTPAPAQPGQQPQQDAATPENGGYQTERPQPQEQPQQAPQEAAPEQPVFQTEQPAAEPAFQPEEPAADTGYQGEESLAAALSAHQAAPHEEEIAQPQPETGFGGNGEALHEDPVDPVDLASVFQDTGSEQDPATAQDAEYEYTADELHQYMASQTGQSGETAEDLDEAFDLSENMALQPFEARYDQHPEVSLGNFDEQGEQPFFHEQPQGDAEFLASDELDDAVPPPPARKKRKALMFGGGLVGALALGGALAFAYKTTTSSEFASADGPPLIKADDRPVKVAPDEPGGKQFAHQNKQIYDRLQGDQKPEVEKIVPRQENVVETPSMPSAGQPPENVASAPSAPATTSPGAPHKVRTLKVMPDGSVVVSAPPQPSAAPAPSQAPSQVNTQTARQPAIPALPEPGSEMAGVAVTMPTTPSPSPSQAPAAAPQVDRTTVASVPQAPSQTQPQPNVAAAPVQQEQPLSSATAPAPLPQPKPAAPARQTASVASTSSASSASQGVYVVQVASRRSQAMALAAFADLQQKYTSLLGDYQPMIQSADLGSKGVWYRLRVGPMQKKADADSLCRDLKRAGLRSCLVRPL